MIGQKVLDLCKLKGLTLRAACQASGLKYSTLHAQISNRRPIPFKTIDKLSRKLNVPLSYFSEGQPLFQVNALATDSAPSGSMLQFETSINAQAKLLASRAITQVSTMFSTGWCTSIFSSKTLIGSKTKLISTIHSKR